MRLAYVGLSLALALFIIAQGVNRPEFFYALIIPIIVFISYIIYLLFNYGDKISTNKVSDYYSTFMNLTNILLGIQIYILLSEITIKSFENFNLTPKILSILKLFSVLTIISGITLGIILKYYNTDG
jgi:hypothetical protein